MGNFTLWHTFQCNNKSKYNYRHYTKKFENAYKWNGKTRNTWLLKTDSRRNRNSDGIQNSQNYAQSVF